MSPYQRLDWKDRRLECPSFPYTGGYIRQYNQHEVDYKRAANTLFDGILTNSQLFVHLSKCHSTVLFIENI